MRNAVSLIELIIAIVVMGFAVMSMPLILTQTQNNNAVALQQEAILATKTKMSLVLSYPWDDNSWDSTAGTFRVMDTTGSASADNSFDTASTRRTGHIAQDGRRRLWAANTAPTAIGIEGVDFDDIDDFHGFADTIAIADPTEMDFLFNISLATSVSYLGDSLSAGGGAYAAGSTIGFDFNTSDTKANPTNIKMVEVHTTGGSGNIDIRLRAFVSNIGQSQILKRDW